MRAAGSDGITVRSWESVRSAMLKTRSDVHPVYTFTFNVYMSISILDVVRVCMCVHVCVWVNANMCVDRQMLFVTHA